MLSTCWHPPFIHGEAPTTTGGSAVERQHRQRPCVPFHENMDDSSVSNEKTLEVNADLKSGLHPEAFGAGGPAAAAAAAAKSCSIREKWQQHPGRALVSRRRSKAAKLLSPTVPILTLALAIRPDDEISGRTTRQSGRQTEVSAHQPCVHSDRLSLIDAAWSC